MQAALAWGALLSCWFGIIIAGMIIEKKEINGKEVNKNGKN